MCGVHAILCILTCRTAISYSYKYSLASPILSFQLVSKCLAQGSNLCCFLLCLVSDCIRECQNNGILNNSTCSCTCAAGFSGPDCGSECTVVGFSTYICCLSLVHGRCTMNLRQTSDQDVNTAKNSTATVCFHLTVPPIAPCCLSCLCRSIISCDGR